MGIFDELKAYWQLNGVGLAKRSAVNIVGNTYPLTGPDRIDQITPGNSPLFIWHALSPPGTNSDDLWLAPYGLEQALGATLPADKLCVPVGRKTYLDSLGFHIVSTPLATDSVEIMITNGTNPTALTLTVPPNTQTSQFLTVQLPAPVVWNENDLIGCRLRQSGSVAVASWNAYIVAC